MAESIATYRKPGFPILDTTENGFRTIIEYIGPAATLEPAEPDIGTVWGDFQGTVRATNYTPTEKATTAELTVTVELTAETTEEPGQLESETFEIDWVVVERSMYEHPQFAIGGGGTSALTAVDIADIENWKNEKDQVLRSEYKYAREYGSDVEITTNARLFARGIDLGQETFDDFAPVARKTSTYVGGAPDGSKAGQKDDPIGFPSLPDGYEWRKSADRAVTAGKRTRWERIEEWLGAKKVLHDKDEIFWAAP